MTNELKKQIVAALAAGGIVAAGVGMEKRLECEDVIVYKDEEICITAEIKEAIQSGLKANEGFGGVRFGGK